MAVVVVDGDNVRLEDMDGGVSTTNIGAGAGPGAFEEAIYQGAGSWGRKIGGTSSLRGFFVDVQERDMTVARDRVLMWKSLIVNSSALDPLGFRARIASGTGDYYEFILADDGTLGDNADFEYPILGGFIIQPLDPNVEAWRDSITGTPDLTAVDLVATLGAITITTVNENVIFDAADLNSSLFVTRGGNSDPDSNFLDVLAADEGSPSLGRFGNYTSRDGILYVFGNTIIGRNVTGFTTDETHFSDNLRTLVFPGGRVDAGWNGLEFDIGNASTVIALNNVSIQGEGRDNKKHYFDTELEVTGGATDEITFTDGHEYITGDLCTYSNEGGTNLGGLTTGTDYFIRRESATTISVYAIGATVGRANSFSGTSQISLTPASAGVGQSHSFRRKPDTRPDLTVVINSMDPLFVAVASDGTNRVMTSPDGINWTNRTAAEANFWKGVTYGDGLFVAVADDGTNEVMTSPDGITWTAESSAGASTWNDVTFGGGLFVAVANGASFWIGSSADGASWTARTPPETFLWRTVTHGAGTFVAIASGGGGADRIMYSADGITWFSSAEPEANSWMGVTHGAGLFVAVSPDGTNQVMTSPDGIEWTARSEAEANSWESVVYGNGLYVAVASDGTNRVMTSSDGITWGTESAAQANSWHDITFGIGLFVAISQDGTDQVMTSPDGSSWTNRSESEANTWEAVTFGGVLKADDPGTFDANGCTLTNCRQITLAVNATLLSCVLTNCFNIDIDLGSVDGCSINTPLLAIGESFITASTLANIDNNTFTADPDGGHAVEIDTTGTFGYGGNTHTGYGPGTASDAGVHDNEFDSTSDVNAGADTITLGVDTFVTGDPIFYNNEGGSASIGLTNGNLYYVRRTAAFTFSIHESKFSADNNSNPIALTSTGAETQTLYSANAAIHNTSGGLVTVQVSAGGDTPSIRNSGAGSTTNVENNVALTLSGLRDNTEVRVYTAGTTTELAGIENATDGSSDDRSVTFSLPASVSVDIRFAHGTAADGNVYRVPDRNSILAFTWPTVTSDLPITQVLDRAFDNPD